jgi:hypothetical protein
MEELKCPKCGKLSLTVYSRDRHFKTCKESHSTWVHIFPFKESSGSSDPLTQLGEYLAAKKINWNEGSTTFCVERANLFKDSLDVLVGLPAEQWFKEFNVKFLGEVGDDAGGITKEWINLIIKEFFVQGLFKRTETEEEFFTIETLPNPYQDEKYFVFGKLIGKLLLDKLNAHCRIHFVILKQLLNKEVEKEDFREFNPNLNDSLKSIENQDINDLGLGFFTFSNKFGEVELKPGGQELEINNDNKSEYITLTMMYSMKEGIKTSIESLKKGLYSMISPSFLNKISTQDFFKLINGPETIEINDLQIFTDYLDEFTSGHVTIILFWKILKSWEQSKLRAFLKFVTGSPCPPLQGFSDLRTLRGEKCRFNLKPIQRQSFPRGHTCFNRLDLPVCSEEGELREKLDFITQHEFGFNIS